MSFLVWFDQGKCVLLSVSFWAFGKVDFICLYSCLFFCAPVTPLLFSYIGSPLHSVSCITHEYHHVSACYDPHGVTYFLLGVACCFRILPGFLGRCVTVNSLFTARKVSVDILFNLLFNSVIPFSYILFTMKSVLKHISVYFFFLPPIPDYLFSIMKSSDRTDPSPRNLFLSLLVCRCFSFAGVGHHQYVYSRNF